MGLKKLVSATAKNGCGHEACAAITSEAGRGNTACQNLLIRDKARMGQSKRAVSQNACP